MTDTEKLQLLRRFIAENITCRKPHEAQGITAREEYHLIVDAKKVMRQTRPNLQTPNANPSK